MADNFYIIAQSLFPALWSFFSVPFPFFGITVLHVAVAGVFVSICIFIIRFLLRRGDS